MELQEAIVRRRSVRKFTDHYVTDDEIRKMLDAARQAPSWANTQGWSFVVVRDRELIGEITETYSKTNPARGCSMGASALIVCCAKKNLSGFKGNEPKTKFREWFMFDLGLAVQNIVLTVQELGLGTVIVGSLDHEACRKLLRLPEDTEAVVVLPVGRPQEPDKKGPAKKELKELVYLDKYGEMYARIY
ncbi:MAG: nitroreductase family protein [Spirochaetes bacterium]|nr:nitroreductase family protein [Spirochaetota bacterium]